MKLLLDHRGGPRANEATARGILERLRANGGRAGVIVSMDAIATTLPPSPPPLPIRGRLLLAVKANHFAINRVRAIAEKALHKFVIQAASYYNNAERKNGRAARLII
ncbi:hypothetical protein OVA00_08800 [Ensifer sp. SL37]|nr:hypothetical protein [Ensifer sp. SL37]MCY1740627.1 hypothetical protein [Ensifer sp. SL37]